MNALNQINKLEAAAYLLKKAYANYHAMGGISGRGGIMPIPPSTPAPVADAVSGLATHNIGTNTSNVVSGTKPPTAPAAAPAGGADLNSVFKQYMGSSFDPNSKLDQSKMKYLQGLQSKGVKMNAANIYDKAQGYGQF
jgi:hypothetical protein